MKSRWNIPDVDWGKIASTTYTQGGDINAAARALKAELDLVKLRRPCKYNRVTKVVERKRNATIDY